MKHKPQVVFDTNIYISAILFGGNPRSCLELARSGDIVLIISKAILVEVAKKLREKFLWEETDITDVIEGLLVFITIINPSQTITIIKEDEPDNRILEAAMEAKADYVVSGDKKHLLSLRKFKAIPIISSKEFLDRYYEK